MELITNDIKLHDELLLVAKLFYKEDSDIKITHYCQIINNKFLNTFSLNNYNNFSKEYSLPNTMQEDKKYKYLKRFSKLCLYEYLSKITRKKLAWGSLTGIRPTKLFYELMSEEYGDIEKAKKRLIKEFFVSKRKAEITKQIVLNQGQYSKNDKVVHLYVNIPFCPTRCSYCSFISGGIIECEKYVQPYLTALKHEIDKTLEFLKENNYTIKTVYIGGGTPTSLTAHQLDDLLNHLNLNVQEFTVESGRPDTITKEKLDVLTNHGVTRICINPQTFCDNTLKQIGRNHTSEQVFQAFELAKKYQFEINSDLIAGLENETFKTFKSSLNKAISLNPDNITVHTLSIKKASLLIEQKKQLNSEKIVKKMIDYSYKKLTKFGYKPYYLYKQKNMVGNLENIGYYKGDTPCIFNVVSMEEIASIVACGSNAISKRYFSKQDRIERWANVKNLNEYISRIDEMIEKKNALFKKDI